MSSGELYIAGQIMHKRLAERRQEIENRHRKRQSRAYRQGWLSRQSRRLLGQLGHLLVALGTKLQGDELPQPLPAEG